MSKIIKKHIIHIISLYANVSSHNALIRRSFPVDVTLPPHRNLWRRQRNLSRHIGRHLMRYERMGGHEGKGTKVGWKWVGAEKEMNMELCGVGVMSICRGR